MADDDLERMQNLEDILNEKDSDDDDQNDGPSQSFSTHLKADIANLGISGSNRYDKSNASGNRQALYVRRQAYDNDKDNEIDGGQLDSKKLEDIEQEMYAKYGIGGPSAASNGRGNHDKYDSRPFDSARGQVGKDKVAYSKQQLLEDSDDSDSVLNSARRFDQEEAITQQKGSGRGGNDRRQIDEEFKKIFGDNYDFSNILQNPSNNQAGKKKKDLTSSESSGDEPQNQRYKDIERQIREGDELIKQLSKPQNERSKARGTGINNETTNINSVNKDITKNYNQSYLSNMDVQDLDLLNLDESPADQQLSTFKSSVQDELYQGSELQESLADNMVIEDPVEILNYIEKNEKLNEAVPDEAIQESQQLLSLDKKFYNVDNKLLLYEEYNQIARKLQSDSHKLYGVSQCIGLLKNFMFIGNSEGIIRVFDVKTQKEMMPLKDNSGASSSRVTSIDIHSGGLFLLSGHRDGSIALWDLQEYRLLKHVPDMHQSDVTNLKIYDISKNGSVIHGVSSEDQGGVRLFTISKKALFGGYNVQQEYLFKSKMTATTSIAIQNPNPIYPNDFCDNSIIIAFGALNMITICTMDPIRCIYQLNRPEFCRATTLPYIDWGYGLTPSHRDQTVPIFAFAWDRVIQLVYINTDGSSIEIDGIYYTDAKEIIGLFFIGESILYAIFENSKYGREGKVLYTTKFYPGSYRQLEEEFRKNEQSYLEKVGLISQMTMHAELEKTYNPEMKTQMADLNEFRGQLMQTADVVNYQNSIRKHNQNILFLGQKIIRGRVFSWREYIEEIDKQVDWMSVLKIAMEIYNGDLKGYAKLSDQKEIREQQLLPYMQDLIKRKIEDVLQKLRQRVPKSFLSEDQGSIEYSPEQIAINVSIEFCLNINATDFLFNDVFYLFTHANLQRLFIKNLEPFLMSGKFREHKINQSILNQLILQYQADDINYQKLKSLEKIVQQLDVNNQLRQLQDRTQLEMFCEKHHLITALLSLKNEPTLILRNIFIQMQKIMKKELSGHHRQSSAPNSAGMSYSLKYGSAPFQSKFNKQSIYMLNKDSRRKVYQSYMDLETKYSCERSYCYLGYKIIWIMNTFLRGRNIPYGNNMSDQLFKTHVYQIANLLAADSKFLQFDKDSKGQLDKVDESNFVKSLLRFDAPCFLAVITKLFYGQPYIFVVDKLDQQFEIDKFPGQILKNISSAINIIVFEQNQMKEQVNNKSKVQKTDYQKEETISSLRAEFQYFILKIFVEHNRFQTELNEKAKIYKQINKNQQQQRETERKQVQKMFLESKLIFESICGVLKDFKNRKDEGIQTRSTKELDFFLVEVIKEFRCSHKELEVIQNDLQNMELESEFINLRVQLLEGQDDYIKSFHLQMDSDLLQNKMFDWIESKFQLLDKRADKKKTLSYLKSNVASRMKELIDMDAERTMHLIEEWFDDEYAHKLIHQDLKDHGEVLFKFLTNFIEMNDVSIKITIDKQMLQNEQGEQAEKYKQYLFIYLELMCDMYRQGLQGVTKETIDQFVEKPYLPIKECMLICKEAGQERAIAALQVRDHQFIEALDTFNCYLDKFDLLTIGEDICKLIYDYYESAKYKLRQEDPKRGGKQSSNLQDNWHELQLLEEQVRIIQRKKDMEQSFWTEKVIRAYKRNWAYEECYKYPQLNEFDFIIRRMCEITRKVPEKLVEKAFFIILQPLGQLQKQVFEKIMNRHEDFGVIQQHMKIEMNIESVCSFIEDFIDRRKNAIIENHIPWQISPQKLIQTVELDLKSVVTFFKFKIIEYKSDIKFRRAAKKLLLQEYINLFESGYKKKNHGRSFNNKPLLVQGVRALVNRPDLVDFCQVCSHNIIGKLNKSEIRYFQFCEHKFHQHCLNSIKKEQYSSLDQIDSQSLHSDQDNLNCPQCMLTSPTVILKDLRAPQAYIPGSRPSITASALNSGSIENKSVANLEKSGLGDNTQALLNQSSSSAIDSHYSYDGSQKELLKFNQLEQFDMTLSQSQLFSNDFYED